MIYSRPVRLTDVSRGQANAMCERFDIIYFTLIPSCFIIGKHAVTVVSSCSSTVMVIVVLI